MSPCSPDKEHRDRSRSADPKPVKRNAEQDQQVADRIAVADLDTYMKQLRRLAKVALRKRPDLLKKLNG